MTVLVRAALAEDADAIWYILEPVIRAGETNALARDMPRDAALAYWHQPGNDVFVAELNGRIAGTYFVRPNQQGGGAHVANAGYMTGSGFTGRGIARRMCEHSLARASARGFRAMQFNFVVSSNHAAVHLWQRCGFSIVGRLPAAFEHPVLGFVDVLILHRPL